MMLDNTLVRDPFLSLKRVPSSQFWLNRVIKGRSLNASGVGRGIVMAFYHVVSY